MARDAASCTRESTSAGGVTELLSSARATGPIPQLRGFSYRASADYAFANRTPYTVGVHQSSGIAQRYFPYLPEFDKWYLAPVDTFRVTVGLGYDLSL